MRVGVIGTGAIGYPMVERLLYCGNDVFFYARRREVIISLSEKGAVYMNKQELARNSEVVLLIVNTYEQCEECIREVLDGMPQGSCLIVHSTVAPNEMKNLNMSCTRAGVEFLAAPVTGGVAGARKGTLTIIVGGKKETLTRVKSVLNAMGSTIIYTGENPEAAAIMKLLVQMLVGINTTATAEALVLGEKNGLDPHLIYKTICASAGTSLIFRNRANTIMERDFATRGTIEIMYKDLRYCAELAAENGCTLPVTQSCFNMFQIGAKVLENKAEDFSAIVKVYEKWANTIVDGRE